MINQCFSIWLYRAVLVDIYSRDRQTTGFVGRSTFSVQLWNDSCESASVDNPACSGFGRLG